MARTHIRVSTVKVNFDDIVVSNYSTAHIMQLARSAKTRSEQKQVPFDGLDALYYHVLSELKRNNNRCPCCQNTFFRKAEGKGGGGKQSLSLHRVVASRGYVTPNIEVICQSCNNAIGETNTYHDVVARVKALRWQAKIMKR